jgi:hypothetical protein
MYMILKQTIIVIPSWRTVPDDGGGGVGWIISDPDVRVVDNDTIEDEEDDGWEVGNLELIRSLAWTITFSVLL